MFYGLVYQSLVKAVREPVLQLKWSKIQDKCDRKTELMLFYESQRTSKHTKRETVVSNITEY
jgi:hypothetical protein